MQDKGQKTSQDLAAGPRANRGCTDILCLLLFLLFGAACGFIAMFSFQNGNPALLAQPYDPDHQPCGIGKLKDYPFIYFASPTPEALYRTVCVKSCPGPNDDSLKCSTNSVVTSCDQNLSPSTTSRTIVYDTAPYGDIICLPKVEKYLQKISTAINVGEIDSAMSDLKNSWMIITSSGFLAIIMGFIFLRLVRLSAGCVVWSFILLTIAGLLGAGAFCLKSYDELINSSKQSKNDNSKYINQANQEQMDPNVYKYLAITFFALAGIAILIICCMRSRIRLCIAIIKCSARFVSDTKSILIVPVIFFILTFGYVVYWLVVACYLYSSGTISDKPHSLPFGQFKYSQQVTYFGYAHIFSLLWSTCFLIASCQFVIIGACSYWYYQRGDSNNTTLRSIRLLLRYHIGTVAFGSLILAIIQAIRIILAYIDSQIRESGGNNNDVVKYILRCMECCLLCFKRFIEFLNKNAYIQTVMTGNSFCTAAKDAFTLILRNPLRISLVSGFGDLFEFLGNLAIMMATTFTCYFIITNTDYYKQRLQSPVPSTVCFAILSYAVGNFFMSLFGTAADCIIILFCMDEEMHVNAKFEPKELREFREDHDAEQ